jgi:hypothetical protein
MGRWVTDRSGSTASVFTNIQRANAGTGSDFVHSTGMRFNGFQLVFLPTLS